MRNGKQREKIAITRLSENDSLETNTLLGARGSNTDFGSQTRILTQKEVEEQIKNYITFVTMQLEDLTWLITGCRLLIDKSFPQKQVPVLIPVQPVFHLTWWLEPREICSTLSFCQLTPVSISVKLVFFRFCEFIFLTWKLVFQNLTALVLS